MNWRRRDSHGTAQQPGGSGERWVGGGALRPWRPPGVLQGGEGSEGGGGEDGAGGGGGGGGAWRPFCCLL